MVALSLKKVSSVRTGTEKPAQKRAVKFCVRTLADTSAKGCGSARLAHLLHPRDRPDAKKGKNGPAIARPDSRVKSEAKESTSAKIVEKII
jgi:hypothetical protein